MRRMGRWPSAPLSFDRDQCMVPLADGSEGRIFAGMADILESAPRAHEEPKLVIRKAPHVPVWSVWATLQSPTLYNCCVRFAMVVTSHDATLATRRALPPYLGRTFTGWISPASWRTSGSV